MGCQLQRRDWVDSTRRALHHALWPAQCLLCGGAGQQPTTDICQDCEADLVQLRSACARCAQPLAAKTQSLCGRCLRRPPSFDRAVCAYHFEAPLDAIVRRLKYRGDSASGRLLAQLFCKQLQLRSMRLPDCIIPVPLAPRRYRERGFNQASELGAQIEQRIGVPLRADIVVRIRDTSEQARLALHQRRLNVRKAFAVIKPLAGQRVAVLDDVMTTGSTVNEVARVVRAAGASDIEVWAIARAG